MTELMSMFVHWKPIARKVYLRSLTLLETEYQRVARYVLMIFASVAQVVAYVQEKLIALSEVIS